MACPAAGVIRVSVALHCTAQAGRVVCLVDGRLFKGHPMLTVCMHLICCALLLLQLRQDAHR